MFTNVKNGLTAALLLCSCFSIATAAEIFTLTDNQTDDIALSASEGNAIWQGQDPNGGDWEIFLYRKNTDTVEQLTQNDANDVNPVISGRYAAWEIWDGNDWEICVYNGDEITQITDNDTDDVGIKLSAPLLFWRSWDGMDWEIHKTKLPSCPVSVVCKIAPKTLNLKSKGNGIEAMLFLPKEINLSTVNVSTIRLEGQLIPEKVMLLKGGNIIQMKFSRSQLQAILAPAASVQLHITLYLKDGTKIKASDTIRVIH